MVTSNIIAIIAQSTVRQSLHAVHRMELRVDYNQCGGVYCLLSGLPTWVVMRCTVRTVRLFEMDPCIEIVMLCCSAAGMRSITMSDRCYFQPLNSQNSRNSFPGIGKKFSSLESYEIR